MGLKYEELRRRTEYSYLQAYGRLGDQVNRGRDIGYTTFCATDSSTLRYAYDLKNAVFIHTPDGVEQPRPIYGTILNLVKDHLQHGLSEDDEETVGFGLEGRERQKAVRAEESKQKVTQSWDVCVRAMTQEGFTNLSRLTSVAWAEGCYRGIPRADADLILKHQAGLSISFGGPDSMLGDHVTQGRMTQAVRLAKKLHAVFGDRMYLELMPHKGPLHRKVNRAFVKIARALGITLIAVNDVHYTHADDTDAHTILLCLANKITMEDPDHPRSPPGYHLRTGDEMLEAFEANHPYLGGVAREAIENTVAVAAAHTHEMVVDRFAALSPQVPHDSADDVAEVARLCALGWKWRDIQGRAKFTGYSVKDYTDRLKMELDVDLRKAGKDPIACAKFPGYFLIVRDLINWCRDTASPPIMTGPGRGSAAGSLVCYLLGITSLDPLEHGLLFERFISPERIDMPDIDMDFEDKRREEVITYLHDTWGHDKVSLICTVGRMKGKSALKDVGRVLGVPFGELNDVTGAIVERSSGDERASQTVADSFKEFKVCRDFDARHPDVLPLVVKLEGHARQPGVHAAGVITSPVPLPDVVPIETHMRNNEVVKLASWDMYGVGAMGLLKLDILGLRTLSVLNDARKMAMKRNPGLDLDYEQLPLDDELTLQAFTDHHYVGIFQFDSTGAHAACEGITFDAFGDIVAMVALNRPGPARSGLATEFKKRKIDPKRRDENKVHPVYDDICGDALGVLVYQERVTKIFVQMAGYAPGTADSLRKVIAKKIGDETLKKERVKFVEGAVERGCPAEVAEKIISDITFFGSYGFNKSHSAAYGIIGYWQMWMKAHYPAELMWALMQNEPKREQIARYAKEAKRLGVSVLPPDINASGVGFAINEAGDIVSNLTDIKHVGMTAVAAIEEAQPFTDMVDFFTRVAGRKVNSRVLTAMIKAGAMQTLLPNTRIALETAKEKGSWLDIGRKQKGGWEDELRAIVETMKTEPDYPDEDLLFLAGEVSPLGGGRHPMAVYDNLKSSVLAGCRFTALDDEYFWDTSMPLIAGTMIDIKYNQVGDFDTVEPDEATKRKMGWGKRYANINIEDESGAQVRVKVHQDNFPEFRWILDQGIGTSMVARLLTWKGVKAARALYVVDLETMRGKARHELAMEGYEKLLTDQHPARKGAKKGDVIKAKQARSRPKMVVCGLIIGHKHIITRRTGQDMGFITLELADHTCLEVTVFPDDYADWAGKLKVNHTVRIDLKRERKRRSLILGEDGVLETVSTSI